MGTTANGLRYPEPSDPIAAGAAAIQALAEDLRIYANATTYPAGSSNPGTVTVTFPVGLFTAPPRVITSARNPYASSGLASISATSASLYGMWRSASGAVTSPTGSNFEIDYSVFQIGGA